MSSHTVLLIEDNPGDARLIREMLAEEPEAPFELHCAERLSLGLDFLAAKETGLVLLDLSLPDSLGLETFAKVYAHSPAVPIIVLTKNDDQTVALSAVKGGAQDFLVKGKLDRDLLVRSMRYSIERKRYQVQIEHQAHYDTLTGLPSRNLLNDRLSQAIAQSDRSERPIAVLFADVDHLKRINDSIGHVVGDQVIASIGARLAGTLRTGDTVARMGGDEFVAVLANLNNEEDAVRVAQKLRETVAAPLKLAAHEFVLSASVGIALYPKDGADSATLLRNADAALYRCKELGRDCIRFFAPEMNERLVQYLTLEENLRRALEAQEFRLQYQPIVRLATGETVGAEALIRWRRADGNMIPPAQFIPVAEESGLIVPIGRWVIESAARQAAEWNRGRRAPMFVSVNLSARQFRDPKLIDTVRAALESAKVDPSLIKLEITESTVMQNAEEATATLHALKTLGVLLSVDDFGTGYSSLSYLKRFPIDTLKIDRSFVRDLPADRDDLAISRAVIELAHGLELEVIAEGVETREQAEVLAAHGCELAQGYLFGRPQDPEQFETLRRSGRAARRAAGGATRRKR